MEVGLMKKINVARSYIKFARTLKRCGICYCLAGLYIGQPEKMCELKDKLCPNCSKVLREAGELILKEVK